MDQVCCSDKFAERWDCSIIMFCLAAETRPLFGHALLQPDDDILERFHQTSDGAEPHDLVKLKPPFHWKQCFLDVQLCHGTLIDRQLVLESKVGGLKQFYEPWNNFQHGLAVGEFEVTIYLGNLGFFLRRILN